MSRQSCLPPRCVSQRNHILPSISKKKEPYYPQHHRSPSHSSILDEQPAWLDDLLSEEDSNAEGSLLRRTVSDPVTLLHGLTDSFSGLKLHSDEENSTDNETGNKLDSASMYGPNSPRRRCNVAFSENALASALSEYALQNPLRYVDGSICVSGMNYSGMKVNACNSMEENNSEAKNTKRHSGQRSRVRKLQYIAELEKSVHVLQTLEVELTVRVASQLQKRAALSMENSKLKQQIGRLRQEKLIAEGEYKLLKKEVQRLRNTVAVPVNNPRAYIGSTARGEAATLGVKLQMLDMAEI